MLEAPLGEDPGGVKLGSEGVHFFPPLFVSRGRDPVERHQAAKLVARVNAAYPARPAALLVDVDIGDASARGAAFSAQARFEADEEAFLFWALAGRGREALPKFVRQPAR